MAMTATEHPISSMLNSWTNFPSRWTDFPRATWMLPLTSYKVARQSWLRLVQTLCLEKAWLQTFPAITKNAVASFLTLSFDLSTTAESWKGVLASAVAPCSQWPCPWFGIQWSSCTAWLCPAHGNTEAPSETRQAARQRRQPPRFVGQCKAERLIIVGFLQLLTTVATPQRMCIGVCCGLNTAHQNGSKLFEAVLMIFVTENRCSLHISPCSWSCRPHWTQNSRNCGFIKCQRICTWTFPNPDSFQGNSNHVQFSL